MKFLDAFRSALQAIVSNKLRSSLTILGVVIGIAAVIAMVAVGNGVSAQIKTQIGSLGTNVITVSPGNQTSNGLRGAGSSVQTLTIADMNAIQSQLESEIVAIEAEQRAGNWQVTAGTQNWNSSVTGVTVDYTTVRDWDVSSGSWFTQSQIDSYAQLAVIGSTTASQLFGDSDPVGKTIQLRSNASGGGSSTTTSRIIAFKVIGVLAEKGSTAGFSRDDTILVPATTAGRVLQGRSSGYVDSIVIKGASAETMTQTTSDVSDLLMTRHKIKDASKADFTVSNQNDTLSAFSSVGTTLTYLLAAIGSISLLVGGIGIMNIMLVSVNERTREIGLRKAIGARRQDILTQFLVEAIGLTGVGGILGVTLGWAITVVMKSIPAASSIPVAISTISVVIAVGVSVVVGLIFGLYPAMRAARLRPIEALRYE